MLTYPSISVMGADLVCDDINNHKKRSLAGDISMSLIHLHVGLSTSGQLLLALCLSIHYVHWH